MALTTLLLVACGSTISLAADTTLAWNYIRSDLSKGPLAWAQNFPQCGLDRNSPIDFVDANAVLMRPEPWILSGWNTPNTWDVEDEEYTVKFSLAGSPISTNGGNLEGQYDVLQFHLHWGPTDSEGAEHTIGGRTFPMELHIVHKSSRYLTLNDAVISESDDALGAIGFFFEIQRADNPRLVPLINGIKAVRAAADDKVAGYSLNALSDFLPTSGNFYRYFGGLTTPGCNQIVRWTVFQRPVKISASQMAIIRNQPPTKYGTKFYRPVVALGSRTVTLYTACGRFNCGRSRRPRGRFGRRRRNRNRNRRFGGSFRRG